MVQARKGGAILALPLAHRRVVLNVKRCRVAVLASGTGSNFGAIAKACQRDEIPATAACLISDRPDAPALDLARSYGVEAHVIEPPTKKARLPAET